MHIFCYATLCPNGCTTLPCALQRPHLHTHLPATRACCSGVSVDATQQQHDTMGADSHAPPPVYLHSGQNQTWQHQVQRTGMCMYRNIHTCS